MFMATIIGLMFLKRKHPGRRELPQPLAYITAWTLDLQHQRGSRGLVQHASVCLYILRNNMFATVLFHAPTLTGAPRNLFRLPKSVYRNKDRNQQNNTDWPGW